jgi:hypothetical protein
MNRRALLIRTITAAMSATVFTATGWLMGTRTLTMTGDGTWTPWYFEDDCSSYGSTCSCQNTINAHCDTTFNCVTGVCYEWDLNTVYCCGTYPNWVECKFRTRAFGCGSCNCP